MSGFQAKMHQIVCRPAGGAYSAPPDPYLDFRGLLLRGREGTRGEGRDDRTGEVKDEGGEGQVPPKAKSSLPQNYVPGAGAGCRHLYTRTHTLYSILC